MPLFAYVMKNTVRKKAQQRSIHFFAATSKLNSDVLCDVISGTPKSLSFFYDGSPERGAELNHIQGRPLIWVRGCVNYKWKLRDNQCRLQSQYASPFRDCACSVMTPFPPVRCHPRREHYIHGEEGAEEMGGK